MSLKSLLHLQELDLKIERLKSREIEIPKQKGKFEIHRKRLADELAEREQVCKSLLLEQRECEKDIEQKQAQIGKYDSQLFAVKKNEEYQALLHEIEMLKKQVALKEERILNIMVEIDDARARLEEDKNRISCEQREIDQQCGEIDAELAEAVAERTDLEAQRVPITEQVEAKLLTQYKRIRMSKRTGAAVVPLNGEVCTGCHMHVPPQVANEVLAGELRSCAQCGRLLYNRELFEESVTSVQ